MFRLIIWRVKNRCEVSYQMTCSFYPFYGCEATSADDLVLHWARSVTGGLVSTKYRMEYCLVYSHDIGLGSECYVHRDFLADDTQLFKRSYPSIRIAVHSLCGVRTRLASSMEETYCLLLSCTC